MESGGAKLLGWVGDETPWQLGAVFASPKTLANGALVTKLLAALARADREYHDVILASVKDGKAEINDKTKPLLEIIAKYTNLPVEQVVGNCAYIDPDGKLDVKNVANQIEWLQEQGFVDKGFARRCDPREGICEGGLSARANPSLRAERSNPSRRGGRGGLLRRFAPRNDARVDDGRQMDLIADHISHRFGALDVLDDVSFTVALGRSGRDRRSVRLRQEHAAVDPRRPAAAERGARPNCAARRRPAASIR